jgi:hypothetical protein
VVRKDQGLYLFKGTINRQLLAMGIYTGLHEVRILFGRSHPRGSRLRLASGERVVTGTTVHAVDRLHREAKRLLIRVGWTTGGHSIAIHGPIEMRTHDTIGVGDSITDFILERLGRVGRGSRSCLLLRPLQMGLGVRQVGSTSRVTPTNRALLEVTLQDVTAGEGVLAQNTHVGAITGVCDALVNANLLYVLPKLTSQ